MKTSSEDSVSEPEGEAPQEARVPHSELDLSQFLPYRLYSLADRISQTLSRIYAERFAINITEWRVLAWLSHRELLTAKQISEYTRMDKVRVSRAVQALEERGLIRRSQSSSDLRVNYLHLTNAGAEMLNELIPKALDWETELVAPLDAVEYRDLLNTMGKLERQLERLERRSTQS